MIADRLPYARKIMSRTHALARRIQPASLTRRFRSSNLRFKIAFFTVGLLISTSIVLFAVTIRMTNDYVLSEIIKRGESVGKSIAAAAGYSLLSRDILGLDNLVFQAQLSNDDIMYAAIVDPEMHIVVDSDTLMRSAEAAPAGEERLLRKTADGATVVERDGSSGTILEVSCPVVFMQQPLGSVVIGMNKSVLIEARRGVARRLFIVFGMVVILGMFASSLLATFLMKPIRELSAGVAEMKKGASRHPLKIYSNDELGRLTADFNEMSALIAKQQGHLNAYARDLEEAYVSIVKVVAAAIDARDAYTHGHCARVAQLSALIGRRMGLSPEDLGDLEIACLFHDIGKIKIPDSILLKQGRLNPAEYKEMMRHVEYGSSILSWAPSLVKYIPATRHHHEWHNGKGYPDGLSDRSIPLFAAIIAVADSFDAMTTDRPYRRALPREKALHEIAGMSGTQFRPDLVTAFLEQMERTSVRNIPQPILETV